MILVYLCIYQKPGVPTSFDRKLFVFYYFDLCFNQRLTTRIEVEFYMLKAAEVERGADTRIRNQIKLICENKINARR